MSESTVDVPGARLRYRLAGTASALPLLVLENGWGASYEQWALVERDLAPHAQLLLYDRRGIGGSTFTTPSTVASLTADLAALLAQVAKDRPVVLAGHSYGGLMVSLHVAQRPDLARGAILLDATPEVADPLLDQQLRMVRPLGRLAATLASMGIPDPFFSPALKSLPDAARAKLKELSFGSAPSLRASLAELDLLPGIRDAIARASRDTTRLAISAGRATQVGGLVGRLTGIDAKAKGIMERMQVLHRATAGRFGSGTWEALPHDHGALTFTPDGARDTAGRFLAFARSLG